jgi:hypothetical protein
MGERNNPGAEASIPRSLMMLASPCSCLNPSTECFQQVFGYKQYTFAAAGLRHALSSTFAVSSQSAYLSGN